MKRRAAFSPRVWKQNLLILSAMGFSVILLGCGGGGGGGSTPPPPTQNVIVISDPAAAQQAAATGMGLQFLDAAGNAIGTPVLPSNDGTFNTTIPANAAFFKLTAPSPSASGIHYDSTTFLVNNVKYATYNTASTGGPCVPAYVSGSTYTITLIPADPPPAPVLGCPR